MHRYLLIAVSMLFILSSCEYPGDYGGLGEPCYDDGTCESGLICEGGKCVHPPKADGDEDPEVEADEEGDIDEEEMTADGDPDEEIDLDADVTDGTDGDEEMDQDIDEELPPDGDEEIPTDGDVELPPDGDAEEAPVDGDEDPDPEEEPVDGDEEIDPDLDPDPEVEEGEILPRNLHLMNARIVPAACGLHDGTVYRARISWHSSLLLYDGGER